MGGGGADDGALGRSAVSAPGARVLLLLAVASGLSGCKDLSTVAAIASGSATSAVTGNPAIGVAVGLSVGAGGDFLVRYIARVRAGTEQDLIAETAGRLSVGGEAPWAVHHTIPIGNQHGELAVVDEFTTPIAVCKEVIFSVIAGRSANARRNHYSADVCRDPRGWKWATAEPAVERWGFLQ